MELEQLPINGRPVLQARVHGRILPTPPLQLIRLQHQQLVQYITGLLQPLMGLKAVTMPPQLPWRLK